ncbi:hypothetical protein [Mucilaginibacter flavus]|uniref:hypothetical protein n=1 Tax=Mucilaginibacter flavus TaxID=931504 RepID=UPI0025B40A70|nr:hypothetical protein [Mucilaginibacter flavus]MDN3581344.1 hypothetical protein [Mucilaginibacter flavus]
MDDHQLDNDLKNRIREVFDNYEDTTADEGWLLLRERFPEEEKKRPVAWLWWAGVAAGLLLFLSIGVWMLGKKQRANDSVAINPIKQHQHKTEIKDSAAQLASTLNTTGNKPADSLATSTQNNIIPNSKQTHKSPVGASAPVQNNMAQSNVPVVKSQAVNNANTTQASNMLATNQQKQPALNSQPLTTGGNNGIGGSSNVAVVTPQVGKQTNIAATTQKGTDTAKLAPPKTDAAQYAVNNNIIPNKTADSKPAATDKQFAKTATSASAMDAMFKAEQNQSKRPEEKPADDKRVKFGVYAATFFNYAKGSSNQVNAGAGFTSDIKLSKNLKLSTGIALAQNTLKYNSTTPPNTNAASALAFAATKQEDMLAPASSLPTFKNYNASLVGLDVPINIKYEFNPQKTDAYISAGLSSGTFINEAYTTSYGITHNSLLAGVTQQTTDQTDKQSFNSFYFARTLNVSVGLGTAIGKSNRLVIEPFLKYPLQGLGSQQIKFGAGGVNLKFNFTNKK